MSDSTPGPTALIYKASPKHCEPITAQRPGTKCPAWSAAAAQALLGQSERMGQARVTTLRGMAFVARDSSDGTWHGYPESWDRIDAAIRSRWLKEGRIARSDLTRWWSRDAVAGAWKESP